jgi:hypothetical protein
MPVFQIYLPRNHTSWRQRKDKVLGILRTPAFVFSFSSILAIVMMEHNSFNLSELLFIYLFICSTGA